MKHFSFFRRSQASPFDHVTNIRSRDSLKNLYIHLYKVLLANKLDRLLALRDDIQHANTYFLFSL